MTTDGTLVTRRNSAETFPAESVLEMYWRRKQRRGNNQDQCVFNNLPISHQSHVQEATTARLIEWHNSETETIQVSGELPRSKISDELSQVYLNKRHSSQTRTQMSAQSSAQEAISPRGLQRGVIQGTGHGHVKQQGRGSKALTPRESRLETYQDKAVTEHKEPKNDSILPNIRKRQLSTALEEAGSKRRKHSNVLGPCSSSYSVDAVMQDLEDSQEMAMSKPVKMCQPKQALNADGKGIQLQIQGEIRAKSQQQRKPHSIESGSRMVNQIHIPPEVQAQQPERSSLSVSNTSVLESTNLGDKQTICKQQEKVHTGHLRTLGDKAKHHGEELGFVSSLEHVNRGLTARATSVRPSIVPVRKQTPSQINKTRASAILRGPMRGEFIPGRSSYTFGSAKATKVSDSNAVQSQPVALSRGQTSQVQSRRSKRRQKRRSKRAGRHQHHNYGVLINNSAGISSLIEKE